ncbi:MAG: PEP-CTERM sorting domain-containing protein [Planctomycetia bacterium]|nr:PEP-CTERM sorting domain-containing protein [Planctomycetia bacterium]
MKMKNRTGSSGIGYFQIVDIHFKERMRHHHSDHEWFTWRFDIGGVPYFYIDDFRRVGDVTQSHVNTAAVTGRETYNQGWGWGWDHDYGYGGYGDYSGGGGGGGDRSRSDPRITYNPNLSMEEILALMGNSRRSTWEFGVDGDGSLYSAYASASESGNGYAASQGDRSVSEAATPMVAMLDVADESVVAAEPVTVAAVSGGVFSLCGVSSSVPTVVEVQTLAGELGLQESGSEVVADGYSLATEAAIFPVSPVGDLGLSAEATLLLAASGLLSLNPGSVEQLEELEEQAQAYAQASSRLLRSSIAMNVGIMSFSDFDYSDEGSQGGQLVSISSSVSSASGGKTVRSSNKASLPSREAEAVPQAGGGNGTNSVPEPGSFWLFLLGWMGICRAMRRRR